MKRKTSDISDQLKPKKRALSTEEVVSQFHDGLFEPSLQQKYTEEYALSAPYKHGVIRPLINPLLLRHVREEIQEHLQFTEKETDIYKIFQSGDLVNLDGLDDASQLRLPSLLKLRDVMYSARFREFLSSVTGSGKLSGRKTDMAINVYTDGCHLLCHDDVIGSRRISYILYLTDPETPWRPEWGGALRMYPTKTEKDANDEDVVIPSPDYSLSIPPAFNQLSFFTVQPGVSFHDVEEVYYPKNEQDKGTKRVRMAISGWFHIPQEGEDGYEEGLEEKLAERSSLAQLQGRGDIYDLPQPKVTMYKDENQSKGRSNGKEKMDKRLNTTEFTEADLSFLVQYIAPSYLTPDIAEEMSETFSNESSLNLERFLSEKFAAQVRAYIEGQERQELPKSTDDIQIQTGWTVARPPHKHRYMFQQPQCTEQDRKTPIQELLEDLFPSQAFRKWLSLVTGADQLTNYNLLARRFRRGQDYTLASGYEGESPRLEFTLCLTPTPGWEREDTEEEQKAETENKAQGAEEPSVGGYEIYMAGDEEERGDAAVYRSAGAEEDSGILFTTAAGWNRLSIVLRDSGTLKFVKYVSEAAKGDRWDITGEIEAEFGDEESETEGNDRE